MTQATAAPLPATAAPTTKGRRGGALSILLCIFMVVMVVLLRQGFLFFMMAMLPSLVAYVTDLHARKHRFLVILFCNLAGAMPYISKMIYQSGSSLQAMLADMNAWLVVYAAAALGWGFNWVSPYIAQLVLEGLHAGEASLSRAAQERLAEEWGHDIKR